MQDVFVQVLRHRDRLESDCPSSLFYRIATNVCLNRLRTRRRHPEERDAELLERIAASGDVEATSASRRLLGRLFSRVPTSSQTIAVLHLVDGMTLEEVAREVGLSVSGVRKRLRALASELNELGGI